MYDDAMEMHMNPLPHFNSTFAGGRVWPYGAPFVNLLLISLLAFFIVICSFIYDNFITDRLFSQITNFTTIAYFDKTILISIGYLIKPMLRYLVI